MEKQGKINISNKSATFGDDINNRYNYESILTAKCSQTPLRTDTGTVKMCHSRQTHKVQFNNSPTQIAICCTLCTVITPVCISNCLQDTVIWQIVKIWHIVWVWPLQNFTKIFSTKITSHNAEKNHNATTYITICNSYVQQKYATKFFAKSNEGNCWNCNKSNSTMKYT